MQTINGLTSYHAANDVGLAYGVDPGAYHLPVTYTVQEISYDFQNFFHPFVGALIKQLNLTSVSGMLDTDFLATCYRAYTSSDYVWSRRTSTSPCRAARMPATTGSFCTISPSWWLFT